MSEKSYPRRISTPGQSFFLLGLRGAGKSTWARWQFPDALWIDLLDEARYQDYLVDPSLFALDLQSAKPGSWVVVDEIQRLPNLLNEVHRHIEARQLNFALLGSSARKLKAAGVNLLAGRALHRTMHPLSAAELGDDFDLEAALDTGTIPLVWMADDRRAVLESYARLYLREEIRAEGLVRNLPGIRYDSCPLPPSVMHRSSTFQAWRVTVVSHGPPSRAIWASSKTHWLSSPAPRLPAAVAGARAPSSKALLGRSGPGAGGEGDSGGPIAPEERGALLEGWVLHLLRGPRGGGEGCSTTCTTGRRNPDPGQRWTFCLRRGKEFVAIEVKSQPRYHTGMLPGLRAIGALAGLVRRRPRLRWQEVFPDGRGDRRVDLRTGCATRLPGTPYGRDFINHHP